MGEKQSGQPRIDIGAMQARLSAGADRAIAVAQTSQSALPASESKSSDGGTLKLRGGENGGKRELNPGELVRLQKDGSEYTSDTEGRIARARTVEELMELADRISSKKGSQKEKFSLKLPNGLPALLPVNKDFSKKFNALIDRWEKRIVEVFFDDAHREYFQSTLRETLKTNPETVNGDFFSQYLEHFDCSALGDVASVREKLVALWEEYYPLVSGELREQKKQQAGYVVGEEYVLRNDPLKVYVITDIAGDTITYKLVGDGAPSVSSTKKKFLRFLKKKSSLRADHSKKQTSTLAGKPGDQPPLPGAVSSEPSMRSYDELMGKLGEKKRDITLEMKRLESAVAAGLQEIVKIIPDEDKLNAYIEAGMTQLVVAFSTQIIIRLEKMSFTAEERKFFAETFVEKSIREFLK